ncbi:MAG: hypothetical protein A2566_00600 [Candidatus Zambryskibacteria bacterium RIFOXYD1_FULL_40_13]|nr:MAG: hypothetical protein UT25_C0001G0103 [Parcubacteria group bacterium GW2011_GWC1_39_12]KKR19627.1 MAG: hypothetical protein UT49_C0001G0103 [Parcubacteria group bacterium GW2011_GWF1_39_37]KKR35782.1 MAG: hypothetical protein UT68_C0001G0105 [Parcubacteria group bacterium GW2011_GWC2_40_10]KKR52595.1 MAG: hypothetical protein UT89_C0001G0103 [Parcubacteria group bacterium GW2011_GWE1_40_20]KKR68861.1 MAG: hypothetical protein UU11_C0005G0007 [Parcubacteria group bacterium GW2011_GWF2_40_
MIDKSKVGQLALEIAERVKALRQLVRDGATDGNLDDSILAHEVFMIGTATKRLAEKCDVEIP